MNYQKIYNALVEKAKVRGLDKSQHEGYFEIHHILPKCLGGSDDKENLVMFTGREHFIAHLLLWKAFPSNTGLARAIAFMADTRGFKLNSWQYEAIRKVVVDAHLERMANHYKDITGLRFGKLEVISNIGWVDRNTSRLSKWLCRCDCGNEIELPSTAISSGNTRSCGCLALEYRNSLLGDSNPFYGKSHSDEIKAAISKARLEKNIRPWEVGLAQNEKDLNRWALSLSDVFYDLWILFGKPSRRKLRTFYNEFYNDNLEPDYFKGTVKKFSEGWNPYEDERWKSFADNY